MAFCPFFPYRDCPEAGCYLWTDFGCCMIDKPGIPAEYTNPPAEGVDCYIINTFSSNAKDSGDFLILYALASDGSLHFESDITKFTIHQLHL